MRGEMKSEIGGLRSEMNSEVNGLRGEVHELCTDIKSMQRPMLYGFFTLGGILLTYAGFQVAWRRARIGSSTATNERGK